MRRIFRPRNLLIGALLAGAGAAIIAWRRQQADKQAWAALQGSEVDNLATISRIDEATATGVSEAEPAEAAATADETESDDEGEAPQPADLQAVEDLDEQSSSSVSD